MDEQEAIRRCLAGDRDAFAVVVRQYQALILALCLRLTGNREDAADVAQQVFVSAFRHLDQYDPQQPFRPWLCRIATNACTAFLRRHRRGGPAAPAQATEALPDPEPGAPALVDQAEDRERVRRAVAGLPPPYRTVVLLYYFQDLSYLEIARQTGLPVGTVSTQLHRAKQWLRRTLAEGEVNAGATH